MDNDNKIIKKQDIHKEVMLFLGEELESIHKDTEDQNYDIVKEYAKTKKNRSPFVFLLLFSCFVFVFGMAYFLTTRISKNNEKITVSLSEFDDLNLKNILDTVTIAQTNYDNSMKEKIALEGEFEAELKTANEKKENEIFVLDSMNIKFKTVYNDKLEIINKAYDEEVKNIHLKYDEQISAKTKEVQEYKNQLAEFDAEKLKVAREKEEALNTERNLRQMEIDRLTENYENRIKDIDKSIIELKKQHSEEIRTSVREVANQYKAELATFDPIIRDENATQIINESNQNKFDDFDGQTILNDYEIYDENVIQAVDEFQRIYNSYKYLDEKITSLPQKNSIPKFEATNRNLINSLSQTFIDSTIENYYEVENLDEQIEELSFQVDDLSSKIDELNYNIDSLKTKHEVEKTLLEEEFKKQFEVQNSIYQQSYENLLLQAKTNAVILSATDYENIKVFVSLKARYLITEEGTNAEIKAKKTIKGKIIKNEDESFNFIVTPNNDGELPEVDFSTLEPGLPIRIIK